MAQIIQPAASDTDDATIGTIPWSPLGNISARDGVWDKASNIGAGAITHYLRVLCPNPNIPTGSTGISVSVNVVKHRGGTNSIVDYQVFFVKNGVITGNNVADTVTAWPTADTQVTYSGFGVSLSVADLNSGNSGFVISCTNPNASGTPNALIDYIEFVITYTPPASITSSLLPSSEIYPQSSIGFQFNSSLLISSESYPNASLAIYPRYYFATEEGMAAQPGAFAAVYMAISQVAMPSGTMPTGINWQRRITAMPEFEKTISSSLFGISGWGQVTVNVDTSDGIFNGLDLRGAYVTMWGVLDNTVQEFRGIINSYSLGFPSVFTIVDLDSTIFETQIPTQQVSTSLFPTATDLGKDIPVVFGRALQVPLLYIGNDDNNRNYDYLLGYAKGLGGYFNQVFTVYVGDAASIEEIGIVQGTSAIDPITFTGTGINDMSTGGSFDGAEPTDTFEVSITTTGTPDKFTWKKNGVIQGSDINITSGLIPLSNGIKIAFVNTTGHTLGDKWVFTASTLNAIQLEIQDRRPDGWYTWYWVEIISGQGAGQAPRFITSYDSNSNTAILDANWQIIPNNTSTYRLRQWRFYDGSQPYPYPGYAFIRFKARQVDTSGGLIPIYADVDGLQMEKNPVRAIQFLLSNTEIGLGQDIDIASFNTAASDSGISALLCEGVLDTATRAMDVIEGILSMRDMRLMRTDNGIGIIVDTPKTASLSFGFGDRYYENIAALSGTTTSGNISTAGGNGIQFVGLDSIARNVTIQYRRNLKSSDKAYTLAITRQANSKGIDQVLQFPFIYASDTADRVADYKSKRLQMFAKQIVITTGKEGETVVKGTAINLSIPSLGISGIWECIGTHRLLAQYSLALIPYSDTTYVYSPGIFPPDPSPDIPANLSNTMPAPVINLTCQMLYTIQPDHTTLSYAVLSWIAPNDGNYSGATISQKLSSEDISGWKQVGIQRGTGNSTNQVTYIVKGLTPGLQYDFLVQSLNIDETLKDVPGVVVVNQLAGGDFTAPTTPTGLTGNGKLGILTWTWNPNPEPDIAYYKYEIYTSASGGTPIQSGTTTDTKLDYQAQTSDLTLTLTRYLRVRAVDFSGNASAFTARAAATSSSIMQNDIQDNEITGKVIVSNTGATTTSPLISGTITARGFPILIIFRGMMQGSAGLILSIQRNGSVIYQDVANSAYGPGVCMIQYKDFAPGSGSITYNILAGNIPSAGISNRILTLEELRR